MTRILSIPSSLRYLSPCLSSTAPRCLYRRTIYLNCKLFKFLLTPPNDASAVATLWILLPKSKPSTECVKYGCWIPFVLVYSFLLVSSPSPFPEACQTRSSIRPAPSRPALPSPAHSLAAAPFNYHPITLCPVPPLPAVRPVRKCRNNTSC